MAQKRLLFIFNPRTGRSKSHAPLFDALADLSDAGYWVSIRRTAASGDAARLVVQEGMDCDVVVAVGGDGTLNETVSGLMALANPPLLGYLPQGSTNDFAASLQISGNPKEAAALILKNEPRQLDIGLWNDRYFVYVASFGAFSSTSYTAAQTTKNALGHFAYILEGVKDLNSLRPYQLRVTADGEVLDGKYLFALCATPPLSAD